MKKTLLSFSLATLTLAAVNTANAELYYGLGYTQITDGGEIEDIFKKTLDPSIEANKLIGVYEAHDVSYDSGKGISGFIGFPIKNNFAIETRYTYIQDAVDAKWYLANTLGGEETYDFNSDSHKFGVHGVYRHSLNSFMYAKGGVGLTYTMYDFNSTYKAYTNGELQMTTQNEVPKTFKKNNTSVEATLGIGVRLTSCCNIELEYNTSQHNESALASVVWRY